MGFMEEPMMRASYGIFTCSICDDQSTAPCLCATDAARAPGHVPSWGEQQRKIEALTKVLDAARAYDTSPEKGKIGDWALRHQLHEAIVAFDREEESHAFGKTV